MLLIDCWGNPSKYLQQSKHYNCASGAIYVEQYCEPSHPRTPDDPHPTDQIRYEVYIEPDPDHLESDPGWVADDLNFILLRPVRSFFGGDSQIDLLRFFVINRGDGTARTELDLNHPTGEYRSIYREVRPYQHLCVSVPYPGGPNYHHPNSDPYAWANIYTHSYGELVENPALQDRPVYPGGPAPEPDPFSGVLHVNAEALLERAGRDREEMPPAGLAPDPAPSVSGNSLGNPF
jgi:hypothetical protein